MEPAPRVIYVDLDQSLVRIDLLQERLLVGTLRQPFLPVYALYLFLRQGLPAMKLELARRLPIEAAHLPYNLELLGFLEQEKAQHARLILATAAPWPWAQAVAEHLGIFEKVLATTLDHGNLKGARKLAAILEDRPGEAFDYVGDAACDRPIFESAQRAIIVGSKSGWADDKAALAVRISGHDPTAASGWKSLRLHQWLKNILIFAPLVAAHDLRALTGLHALFGFFAFSFLASALYLLNDLYDLDLDRHHAEKKKRASASGRLRPLTAAGLILSLLAVSFVFILFLPIKFAFVLLCYAMISLLYSYLIKMISPLDLVTLAFLYTTRVFAGGVACAIPISTWLLALTFFMALSLSHLKRFLELRQRQNTGLSAAARPAYKDEDASLLAYVGLGCGLIAVLITVLYITNPVDDANYKTPQLLFVICLLQFYWLERIWLLAFRGKIGSDPIAFIFCDKVSYGVAIICFILTWAASIF